MLRLQVISCMFNSAYKIATVWGIPIRLHISLLLMVLYLGLKFGWLWGTLLYIGLAFSIVLHELGHSLVAMAKNCRVREITLLFIGGAAQMERIPTRPMDEFLMAIAGPAVSLVLSGVFYILATLFSTAPIPRFGFSLLEILAVINLGLVLFNMLPAFPMDGGRILRALLAQKLGRLKATSIAATLGKVMAVIFGIYGFQESIFLVAIAFFVYIAADNEYRMVRMQARSRDTSNSFPFGSKIMNDDFIETDDVIVGPPPYSKTGKRHAHTSHNEHSEQDT